MTQTNEKEAKKAELAARSADMEKREKKLNEGRTGKGLRIFLAMTRGKNPQEIQYEAFDESDAKSLPETSDEFIKLAGVKDDKELLSYLIEGFGSLAYSQASDPIAEFVNPAWDDKLKTGFRNAVRAYSVNAKASIEDAVNLIKPGMEAAFQAAQVKAE